jgi:hypothetical protein
MRVTIEQVQALVEAARMAKSLITNSNEGAFENGVKDSGGVDEGYVRSWDIYNNLVKALKPFE